MKIEIAGPGCSRCITTEKNVLEALKQLGKKTDVEHIFDVIEFSKRGVMFTPAVIVDGNIVISGKVPTVQEVKKLIAGIE